MLAVYGHLCSTWIACAEKVGYTCTSLDKLRVIATRRTTLIDNLHVELANHTLFVRQQVEPKQSQHESQTTKFRHRSTTPCAGHNGDLSSSRQNGQTMCDAHHVYSQITLLIVTDGYSISIMSFSLVPKSPAAQGKKRKSSPRDRRG